MKLSSKLVVVTLFLCIIHTTAQDYRFGKVSEEEISEKFYDKDSSAVAAVLYRKYSVSYDYDQNTGFKVVTDVHERVKIYKKEGFNYATVIERLFKSEQNNDKETLRGLKAFTYNLLDSKIEESKLKSSDTFSEEVTKFYNEEKFTLPNVKEGSVIEYTYTLESPFSYSIDEIILQYDIPIKKEEVAIKVPEYFVFNPTLKGFLSVTCKKSTTSGQISFRNKTRSRGGYSDVTTTKFSTNTVKYIINITEYDLSDVPALKEEKYVNNINNYRSTINNELQYTHYPQEPTKSYSTTWDKVAETIYDSPNFGKQLENSRYFKDELPIILADTSNEVEKMNAIFLYVQQYMNWNGHYGKYTDQGVKNAFKEKTGNVADINLMLVAMLKEAGLKSYPVLVSTRNNGIPIFPTREGFNYVIASAEINNEIVLLDATNKYAEPDFDSK